MKNLMTYDQFKDEIFLQTNIAFASENLSNQREAALKDMVRQFSKDKQCLDCFIAILLASKNLDDFKGMLDCMITIIIERALHNLKLSDLLTELNIGFQ